MGLLGFPNIKAGPTGASIAGTGASGSAFKLNSATGRATVSATGVSATAGAGGTEFSLTVFDTAEFAGSISAIFSAEKEA